MKLCRTNALLPFPPYQSEDYTAKAGYPVLLEDGAAIIAGDATGDPPFGVIVEGAKAPEKVTVAVAAGGLAGTVRVKLAQAVTAPGTLLKLVDTAAGVAFGPDTGTGARIVMAQALETGAIGELIEAVLFKPITYNA
jgi:hypothetical protein